MLAAVVLITLLYQLCVDSSPVPKYELVKLSSIEMKEWYSPEAMCMMENPANIGFTYWEKNLQCTKDDNKDAIHFLTKSYRKSGCCEEEMPIAERGFDLVVKGYEDSTATPLVDLLCELSVHNRSLVFLGDSMTIQFFSAFQNELEREGSKIELHSERGIWFPPARYKLTNPVYIMMHWMSAGTSKGDVENDKNVQNYLNLINTKFSGGLYVVFNVGLHMDTLKKDIHLFYSKFTKVLDTFAALSKNNLNTVVAYRETTPTHFHSIQNDGMFLHLDNLARYDDNEYPCTAMTNITFPMEINAIRSLINQPAYKQIGIVKVFEYLAQYHKLHFGRCRVGKVFDCVHFCGFLPLMWMPVWYELGITYRRVLNKE